MNQSERNQRPGKQRFLEIGDQVPDELRQLVQQQDTSVPQRAGMSLDVRAEDRRDRATFRALSAARTRS
jgi:hypothetical protein